MATIRERGGRWQAIVRIKKDGVIIHQETETFSTKKLAESWAEKVEARIKLDGVQSRSDLTLRKLIEKYWTAMEEVKPLRRTRSGELSQLMETPPAKKPVRELTSELFTKFARERHASGTSPATVLHNLSTFASVLSACKPLTGQDAPAGVVAEAIALLRRTGHVSNSQWRDRRPTLAELAKLDKEFKRIAANPTTEIPMDKIVQVLVLWPRRREELCSLEWEHLRDRPRTALLLDTKHPTKVRNETVPIPDGAWDIMMSMPKVDRRVFPFNPESVSKAFARACERLGIDNLRLHDLRHEGVSRLFEAGLDLPEVALVSGHSWNMLRRYTHLRPQAVLEKLNASLTKAQKDRAESEKAGQDHVDHPDRKEV